MDMDADADIQQNEAGPSGVNTADSDKENLYFLSSIPIVGAPLGQIIHYTSNSIGYTIGYSDILLRRNSASRTESLLSRVHRRSEQLRLFFNLPKGESLLDEYHCALAKTLLFQGRMYVFERYVCFYSNIFGLVKQKIVNMADVTYLRKRRHYGFPNSIEIVHGQNDKTEFFTSFLARDEAYQLLLTTWGQSKHHIRQGSSPGSIYSEESNKEEAGPSPLSENNEELAQKKQQINELEIQQDQDGQDEDDEEEEQDEEEEEEEEEPIDEHDSEADELALDDQWSVRDSNPPEPDERMQVILQDELEVSTQQYVQLVIQPSSDLFHAYHNARGDRDLKINSWKNNQQLGHVRELIFVSPVSGKFGPSETSCSQVQRARLFQGNYFVFETSQVMTDIPYGDYFTVEMRWDFENIANDRCRVTVYCSVPFLKRTVVQKMIENSALKQVKEGARMFIQIVRNTIQKERNILAQQDQNINNQKVALLPYQSSDSIHIQAQLQPILEKGESQNSLVRNGLSTAGIDNQQPSQQFIFQQQQNYAMLYVTQLGMRFGQLIIILVLLIALLVSRYNPPDTPVVSRFAQPLAQVELMQLPQLKQQQLDLLVKEIQFMEQKLDWMKQYLHAISIEQQQLQQLSKQKQD
eukprot:TRINITY_DN3739_c0_g1_i5.p1 TRINITY_DN3739_c0_g1~~TRINITY_DN3739_c0_g1_i5.p1  ORF type:complete len:686 (+),score=67.52 TRINITY_DN3739_c0_g1_i5:148-2058(+)